MKQVRIFTTDREQEINEFLKTINTFGVTVNTSPENIIIVYETNKRVADQIVSLEEQRKTSLSSKTSSELSIAGVENEIAKINSEAVEIGSAESVVRDKMISDLEAKKDDYQSIIDTQTFYLSQVDKLIETLMAE